MYAELKSVRIKFLKMISHVRSTAWDAHCDATRLANLKNSEIIEIADYKMKVLAMYFKQDLAKFFGKKGISAHGTFWQFLAGGWPRGYYSLIVL